MELDRCGDWRARVHVAARQLSWQPVVVAAFLMHRYTQSRALLAGAVRARAATVYLYVLNFNDFYRHYYEFVDNDVTALYNHLCSYNDGCDDHDTASDDNDGAWR